MSKMSSAEKVKFITNKVKMEKEKAERAKRDAKASDKFGEIIDTVDNAIEEAALAGKDEVEFTSLLEDRPYEDRKELAAYFIAKGFGVRYSTEEEGANEMGEPWKLSW